MSLNVFPGRSARGTIIMGDQYIDCRISNGRWGGIYLAVGSQRVGQLRRRLLTNLIHRPGLHVYINFVLFLSFASVAVPSTSRVMRFPLLMTRSHPAGMG